MSLGGPKDTLGSFISVGRIVGNGTKASPTGIVDSTQTGLQQVSFPEWGNNVDPKDISLSTSVGTKPNLNQRPFDNGQLVYAMRTTGRTDCIILGPARDELSPDSIPGNYNLNNFINAFIAAINKIDPKMRQKPKKRVNARGAKTQRPDPNTEKYVHNIKKGISTAAELAQLVGFRMPSIGNIPTAVAQFASILSALSSMPGMNMNLGRSLKKMNDNDKKKIRDRVPPEIWEIIMSLIDRLEELSDDDTFSYASDRRVNEEVFIKNAVELLSQVTTVSDVLEVFNRLTYDDTLYGLNELDTVVIEIETAYGNVKQILSANGNVSMNVSNTAAENNRNINNILNSASLSPAGLGDNVFGKDASKILEMIGRMAPQAAARAMSTLASAVPNGRNVNNSDTNDKTHGRSSAKPLDVIGWTAAATSSLASMLPSLQNILSQIPQVTITISQSNSSSNNRT